MDDLGDGLADRLEYYIGSGNITNGLGCFILDYFKHL